MYSLNIIFSFQIFSENLRRILRPLSNVSVRLIKNHSDESTNDKKIFRPLKYVVLYARDCERRRTVLSPSFQPRIHDCRRVGVYARFYFSPPYLRSDDRCRMFSFSFARIIPRDRIAHVLLSIPLPSLLPARSNR